MITDTKLGQAINELKNINEQRKVKYYRNYKRYNWTPGATIENIRSPSVVGYFQLDESLEEDTGGTPQINVIKSCVDTLVSKISQSKVIPFFNTVNGSWKDIQTVKQAQQFFEFYYNIQNVNQKVSLAFRDACIFDTGWIYVNKDSHNVERLLPWQVYVRSSELTYGKISRIYIEQKEYPVCMLPEVVKKDFKKNTYEYCTFGTYYDIENEVLAYHTLETNKYYKEEYLSGVIPVVPMYYNEPIFGTSSQSVVDMLNSIQNQIDSIMAKIKDASELNPAMTIAIPKGGYSVSRLNNRIGNVLEYSLIGGDNPSNPVQVITPAFIDQQYLRLLEQYKQDAYEMVGISMLSAQSKKPTGLNSGVALQSMEDIESERYETQLNQVIRLYVTIADLCIKVFPKDETILPEQKDRLSIKWKDIVKQSERMSIRFTAADVLSKDPTIKLQQLQQMAQLGIIPATRIAQFLEIPDLEAGYNLANNAVEAVMSIIDDCLRNDVYDVPDYVPFTTLKEEIINTQLSLRANNFEKNKEDIDKLQTLIEAVMAKEEMWQAATIESTTTEEGMPVNESVLTQEANMTPVDKDLSSNTEPGW